MNKTMQPMWSFCLTVIWAFIITPHESSCTLSASINSSSLGSNECLLSCSCNPDKETTTITCSVESNSDTEINSKIERILDSFAQNITHLKISDEYSMENIPEIICKMELLEELDLRYNWIKTLPIGCFTRLDRLRVLDVSFNVITELRKGMIEGLQLLEELFMSYNRISFIEQGVFSNQSDLLSLRNLQLGDNWLTSLDSWPFVRAQAHPGCRIELLRNRISSFTNNGDWSFRCGMQPLNINLNLDYNPIKHISDILGMFDIRNFIDFMCMLGNTAFSKFDISFYDVKLTCDCHDYTFIQIARFWRHFKFASTAYCWEPERLFGLGFAYVAVEQLVCDIFDQCPSGCKCTKQPATLTIHVNCTNADLTEMPLNLPSISQLSTYKYNLIMPNTGIKRLDYRKNLQQTKGIDVNNSKVSDIDDNVWKGFQHVNYVNLNGNNLKHIPEIVTSLNYSKVLIDIRDNPFACDCDSKWLKSWLISVSPNFQNPNGINCYEPYWLSGKSILKLDDEEFCRGPPYTIEEILEITIPSISGVILLNVLFVFLLKKFRIQIYKYVKLHSFDRDECFGEDIAYEVFLACAGEDGALGLSLLQFLERTGCGVCYHKKDFIPGETIMDGIMQAVKRSKRTVCVLTGNFIKSGWCMEEFRQSHYRDLQQKKRRLVVLVVDPSVVEMEELSTELRDYLSRYTYIEYKSKS